MTTAENNSAADVLLYEPDTYLKQKLGGRLSLEEILTPRIMDEAQKVVANLEPELLAQITADVQKLSAEAAKIAIGHPAGDKLQMIVPYAFAVKSRAGFCGYPLASSMAKSLHVFCETIAPDQAIAAKESEIIRCLVKSIATVIELRITGDGGKTGSAITAELRNLAIKFS